MKISELRRMANAGRRVAVSELKQQARAILGRNGIDAASIYQEMEMDSALVDTQDDATAPDEPVQLHSHHFYELLYCQSSALEYLLGGKRYRVQRGDVIYIPPGVNHRPLSVENLSEPYRRYVIWISAEYAAALNKRFCDARLLPAEPFLLRTLGTGWEDLGLVFRHGVQEALEGGAGCEAAICANTLGLLVQIMRAREGGAALKPPAEAQELLDKIILYIEKNLARKIALADAAREFGASESAIQQLFRKRLRVSFYRFVIQRRLIAAKALIAEGAALEAASEEAGFGDYSSFYRAFKREYGISPAEYKKLQALL